MVYNVEVYDTLALLGLWDHTIGSAPGPYYSHCAAKILVQIVEVALVDALDDVSGLAARKRGSSCLKSLVRLVICVA